MKIRCLTLLAALALVVIIPGVGIPQQKPIIIRAAHVDSPDSGINLAIKHMSQIVKERTNGRVVIEDHPAGDLMGGKGQVGMDLLMAGNIELSPMSSAYYTAIVPEIGIISLPFLFADVEAQWKWFNTAGPQIIADLFEAKGLKVNFFWPRDLRDFFSRKGPLTSPEQFRGLRIRVMEAPIYVDIMNALGAKPTPMAWGEVYTALQMGSIDAIEPMVEPGYTSGMWEVAKHVTISNYTSDASLGAYNKKFWDSLPMDIKAILYEAGLETGRWKMELEKKMEKDYSDAIKKKGGTVTYLTNAQRQKFREALKPVMEKWKKKYGSDWSEAVLRTIDLSK